MLFFNTRENLLIKPIILSYIYRKEKKNLLSGKKQKFNFPISTIYTIPELFLKKKQIEALK